MIYKSANFDDTNERVETKKTITKIIHDINKNTNQENCTLKDLERPDKLILYFGRKYWGEK